MEKKMKGLSMLKIKEILRLKCEAKLSNRKIARALNISHSVVNEYTKEFEVPLEGINSQTRSMKRLSHLETRRFLHCLNLLVIQRVSFLFQTLQKYT